jgi:hypothetical protein
VVSFYNEIKVLSEGQGIHINEPITTEWKITDNTQPNWHYLINEFLIYVHKKTAAIIATWKQDGSQTEEDWQFIFNSNGYMRQYIKETKLNKGYIQTDASNRLQFAEFATDCPTGQHYSYDPSTHADTTGCTVQDVVKDFATVQVTGIQRAESSTNVHLFAVKHSMSRMGFIQNESDMTNVKNQHFIFGRLSDNKDAIVGIFVGQHATNNGVFYAKRAPSLQSYPVYDHLCINTVCVVDGLGGRKNSVDVFHDHIDYYSVVCVVKVLALSGHCVSIIDRSCVDVIVHWITL